MEMVNTEKGCELSFSKEEKEIAETQLAYALISRLREKNLISDKVTREVNKILNNQNKCSKIV